jgi:hypothetical protein
MSVNSPLARPAFPNCPRSRGPPRLLRGRAALQGSGRPDARRGRRGHHRCRDLHPLVVPVGAGRLVPSDPAVGPGAGGHLQRRQRQRLHRPCRRHRRRAHRAGRRCRTGHRAERDLPGLHRGDRRDPARRRPRRCAPGARRRTDTRRRRRLAGSRRRHPHHRHLRQGCRSAYRGHRRRRRRHRQGQRHDRPRHGHDARVRVLRPRRRRRAAPAVPGDLGPLSRRCPTSSASAGKVVVVKYGGNAMVDPRWPGPSPRTSCCCARSASSPWWCTAAGPRSATCCAVWARRPSSVDGLRVTDAETLDVARMVLVGKVNRDIVGSINVHGAYAVGLSGEDAGLIRAVPATPTSASSATSPRSTRHHRAPARRGHDPGGVHHRRRRRGPGLQHQRRHRRRRHGRCPRSREGRLPHRRAGLLPTSTTPRRSSPRRRRRAPGAGRRRHDQRRHDPQGRGLHRRRRGRRSRAHMLDGRVPHVLLLELFTDAASAP